VELYDFQRGAVDKLADSRSRLIGDDMGLGKTVEALALDLRNRRGRGARTLIVCPTSMVDTWKRHCRMMAPSTPVTTIDRKNREKFVAAVKSRQNGYFILHWEGLRLLPELTRYKWFHIIADECHRAKNRKSQQTRALKRIPVYYRTAMSGTPADNAPQDIWSILNWLWPSTYRGYWQFVNKYVIWYVMPEGYRKPIGVQNLEQLHKEWADWYIRRTKEQVLPDLPEKYYTDIWVDLHPKQRRAYNEMKKDMLTWVKQHEDEDLGKPLLASAVVAQLVRLQQFAVAYCDVAGDKVFLGDPSSKLDALMEILEDNPDEQFVVFSKFKTVINLLSKRLDAKQESYGLYTGDTPQATRDALVDNFQAGKVRIFAGTIAAGGVGITLTASSTVIFLDREWSPSLNKQAEDRLHRIGQRSAVQIIDIMARDTIDIRKRSTLVKKWEWIQALLGDGEPDARVLHQSEG
jgi:SNF2 family DNA or RNA helicase